MPGKAQRVRLRLFVEGVEIPCIAAQLQCGPNCPIVASLQIPPFPEATRFLPRSIVHVFFQDMYEEENPNLKLTGTSVVTTPPTVYQQEDENLAKVDAKNQKWKLLFMGELVGFSWTKNPTQRSIVLQCMDLSSYWDVAKQFNNTDIFGPGPKAMFSGGSTNQFTDFLSSPGEICVKILTTPSERYPEMRGILGGVVHLLEAMGGSYYTDHHFKGDNIFFSLAELRLHIMQLVTAYDKDPTVRTLLGGSYDALFGRAIGNLGEQASFRQVINELISMVFHETYGQPCPRYVSGSEGSVSGFARKKLSRIPACSMYVSKAESIAQQLSDLVEGRDYSERAMTLKALKLFKSDCEKAITSINKLDMVDTSARTKLSRCFSNAVTKLSTAISQVNKLKEKEADASMLAAGEELVKASDLDAQVVASKKAIPAQLKQQIFRPDVWFSAPPRCNVLFPDQYTALDYSRSFIAEPTRLLLKTNDEFFGEDFLFDKYFFAPKSITLKSERNQLSDMWKGDILDHELFTGVVPVFEKMGEYNIMAIKSGIREAGESKLGLAQRATNFLYFKYRFAARRLTVTARFNPYIACGFPGLIVDKYADINALRNYEAAIKALPNNEGYPATSLLPLLGTHFLGSFTDVSHSCSQQDGTTSINCSYSRQPEESVEFLGSVQEEVEVAVSEKSKKKSITTTVASIIIPALNSQGPEFGRIVAVEDVTDSYVMRQVKGQGKEYAALKDQIAALTTLVAVNDPSSDAGKKYQEQLTELQKQKTDIETNGQVEDAKTFPVFGGPRDKSTKKLSVKVPVGFLAPAKYYGPAITTMVGDPDILVRFKAFSITEEKTTDRTFKSTLPPEEYIRPNWYGPCWHPAKIAEVYYDFFNTGSITEPIQTGYALDTSLPVNNTSDATATLAGLLTYGTDEDKKKALSIALIQGGSVQQAVAYTVLTYSAIKHGGFDAEQFIRSYTWRPIASMVDMFGSSDLQLDPTGRTVVKGIEGFHSRAFGSYEDLFGLVTPDIETIVGIKKGSNVAKKGDTRKRKHEAVLAYVAALRVSRASLG